MPVTKVWVPHSRETFLLKREVIEQRALFYKLQHSHAWRCAYCRQNWMLLIFFPLKLSGRRIKKELVLCANSVSVHRREFVFPYFYRKNVFVWQSSKFVFVSPGVPNEENSATSKSSENVTNSYRYTTHISRVPPPDKITSFFIIPQTL